MKLCDYYLGKCLQFWNFCKITREDLMHLILEARRATNFYNFMVHEEAERGAEFDIPNTLLVTAGDRFEQVWN